VLHPALLLDVLEDFADGAAVGGHRLRRLEVAELAEDGREADVLVQVLAHDLLSGLRAVVEFCTLAVDVVHPVEAGRLRQELVDVDRALVEPDSQLVHQRSAGVVFFCHVLPLTRVCNRYDGLFHGKRNMPVAARQLTHRTKIYSD
jgi:hypothetical protein